MSRDRHQSSIRKARELWERNHSVVVNIAQRWLPDCFPTENLRVDRTSFAAADEDWAAFNVEQQIMPTRPEETPPLALRARAAARMLSISERMLWPLTSPRGPIPCVRVGHGQIKGVRLL